MDHIFIIYGRITNECRQSDRYTRLHRQKIEFDSRLSIDLFETVNYKLFYITAAENCYQLATTGMNQALMIDLRNAIYAFKNSFNNVRKLVIFHVGDPGRFSFSDLVSERNDLNETQITYASGTRKFVKDLVSSALVLFPYDKDPEMVLNELWIQYYIN